MRRLLALLLVLSSSPSVAQQNMEATLDRMVGPSSAASGGGGGGGEFFFGTSTPTYTTSTDGPIETGFEFVPNTNGHITGIRFYKDATDTGTHIGNLWSSTGTNLATITFTGETASGWQQMDFVTPIAVTSGTTYMVSVFHNPNYEGTNYDFPGTYSTPHMAVGSVNGWYIYNATSAFPNTQSSFAANFWVTPVYTTP